jgi:hypothetical protein
MDNSQNPIFEQDKPDPLVGQGPANEAERDALREFVERLYHYGLGVIGEVTDQNKADSDILADKAGQLLAAARMSESKWKWYPNWNKFGWKVGAPLEERYLSIDEAADRLNTLEAERDALLRENGELKKHMENIRRGALMSIGYLALADKEPK